VVIALPTLSPAHPRGGSTSRQIFAMRTGLPTLDRATGQSPIDLSRLVRIAKSILGPDAGRPSWARLMPLAHGRRRSTSKVITASYLAPQVAHEYRASRAPEDQSSRKAISLSHRSTSALVPWLASSRFKALVISGSNTQARQPQLDRPVSRQVGTTTPMSPRSHRLTVTQPIALEAIIQVLGSPLSGFGQAFGGSRSPLGQVRPPRLRRAAAVAPFGYNYAGDEPSGGITQLANTSVGAISPASPSQTLPVSRPKRAPSKLDKTRDGNGQENQTGQGDLYLEGSVLGRWLTQHLDRELIRPRAGIMAVDPRLTPSWGGPTLTT
jgi:hypothetical protein